MGSARTVRSRSRSFASVLPCFAAVVVALLPRVVQPVTLADSQGALRSASFSSPLMARYDQQTEPSCAFSHQQVLARPKRHADSVVLNSWTSLSLVLYLSLTLSRSSSQNPYSSCPPRLSSFDFPRNGRAAAALKECAAEWGMSAAEWAQGADCAPEETIKCDDDGMVTELHLNSKNLNGSIPLALTALSLLISLDLQSNSLSGPLPPAFSSLPLRVLRLSNNNLTGPVFTVIARMPSLVELEIYSNSFTGPIPLTVSCLQNLSSLVMNSNDFHGPFPPAFTHLTTLAYLGIAWTGLSGPLIHHITALSSLTSVYAPDNNISGSIPSTITALSRLVPGAESEPLHLRLPASRPLSPHHPPAP
ncbi:unnamed protein product, partial [Closterium sp. Naga37s-1]